MATIRRPRRRPVPSRVIGQAVRVASIRTHHVNLKDVGTARDDAPRHEGDVAAIRRPRRRPVQSRVIGQAVRVASIRTHYINLTVIVAIGLEGDMAAIRRPRRRPVPSRVVGQAAYGPGDPSLTTARHRLPNPCRQRRISRIVNIRYE